MCGSYPGKKNKLIFWKQCRVLFLIQGEIMEEPLTLLEFLQDIIQAGMSIAELQQQLESAWTLLCSSPQTPLWTGVSFLHLMCLVNCSDSAGLGSMGEPLEKKVECLGKGTWQIYLHESCLFWGKYLLQKINWKKVKETDFRSWRSKIWQAKV